MRDARGLRLIMGYMGVALGGLFVMYSLVAAKPMYVYVNDKGTSVMTDALDHVPTQYRKTVKVFEMAEEVESDNKAAEAIENLASVPNNSKNFMSTAVEKIRTGGVDKEMLLLIGGGLIIVTSFATLMFSRNMALKFAMKWLLMCAIVGTGYGWYFSSMGLGGFLGQTEKGEKEEKPIIQRIKDETKEIEEIQKKKLMDIEKLLGEGVMPSEKRTP